MSTRLTVKTDERSLRSLTAPNYPKLPDLTF